MCPVLSAVWVSLVVSAAGSSRRLYVVKLCMWNLQIPVQEDGRRFLDMERQRVFHFFFFLNEKEEPIVCCFHLPLEGRILLLFRFFCPICCSLSTVLYVLEAFVGKKFWLVMIFGCLFVHLFLKDYALVCCSSPTALKGWIRSFILTAQPLLPVLSIKTDL